MHALASVNRTVLLVIEDDDDVRHAISSILEDEGFRAVEAANGRQGLELLRHLDAPPCLILLDLMMPIMNGWQFLEETTSDTQLARIPVIIMTAMADPGEGISSAAALLKKPYSIDDLLGLVEKYCV